MWLPLEMYYHTHKWKQAYKNNLFLPSIVCTRNLKHTLIPQVLTKKCDNKSFSTAIQNSSCHCEVIQIELVCVSVQQQHYNWKESEKAWPAEQEED